MRKTTVPAEAGEMPSAGRIRARTDKGNLLGKLLMKCIACERWVDRIKIFLKIQCMYHCQISSGDYPSQSSIHALLLTALMPGDGGCAGKS